MLRALRHCASLFEGGGLCSVLILVLSSLLLSSGRSIDVHPSSILHDAVVNHVYRQMAPIQATSFPGGLPLPEGCSGGQEDQKRYPRE